VLWKLFERLRAIETDLDPENTGKIFNVLGDMFPANQLERMIREMYARNLTEDVIKNRIIEQVDVERFRSITHSALEGLAKRELNLSAILGKSAEAKERRLVPEAVEDFFSQAAPITGIHPKETGKGHRIYRIGKLPRTLWPVGDRLESRYGKLGREYKRIAFNRELLKDDPTLEWVTPGHPLFECVREQVLELVRPDLQRGAVFYDLYRNQPARLDVFSAAIADGTGRILHRRLFVVETEMDGTLTVRQPTLFLDLALAPQGTLPPDDSLLPGRSQVEQVLIERALQPFLAEVKTQREQEVETVERHLEISLNAIIDRAQCQVGELITQKESGSKEAGLDGRIKQMDDRLFDLNGRLETRRQDLQKERSCTIRDIQAHGRAWALPHPERTSPEIAPIVNNEEIEQIAIQAVIAYEEARGWVVESVESENRGFDLISRQFHPEDSQIAIAVRFIEVKGRAGIGPVALTTNEYKTAERLKEDYWLYVVFNCISTLEIHTISNPARLDWKPLMKIEHYHVSAQKIIGGNHD
ncbi:MAG: DUF3883 domain-containing protein, partial [Planktothrix sp.]